VQVDWQSLALAKIAQCYSSTSQLIYLLMPEVRCRKFTVLPSV
jgi:hypothetical protein